MLHWHTPQRTTGRPTDQRGAISLSLSLSLSERVVSLYFISSLSHCLYEFDILLSSRKCL